MRTWITSSTRQRLASSVWLTRRSCENLVSYKSFLRRFPIWVPFCCPRPAIACCLLAEGYRPNNQRRPGGPRRDGAGPGVGGAGTRGYDDRGALAGGRGGRNREDRGTGGGINKHLQRLRQRNQQNARAGGGGSGSGAVRRETSVKIGVDWIPLETFNLHELGKLATGAYPDAAIVRVVCVHVRAFRFLFSAGLPTATDLKWAGTLEAYDEEFDKVTAKTARKLRRFDEKDVAFVKTQDDAVMQVWCVRVCVCVCVCVCVFMSAHAGDLLRSCVLNSFH
jgi:hypothetical protein